MINTCALDAILQILATSIVDYVHYARFVNSSSCSILKLAHHLAMNGADQEFYKYRILIIKEYTKKNIRQTDVVQYDAQANTNILIEKLLIAMPSIQQFNTCSNSKCEQLVSGVALFPIDLLKLYTGNFFNLGQTFIYFIIHVFY